MTYNPNIPSGTDVVSSDLSQMQVNFSQANTLFANDHWEFNNGTIANRGYHRQVTMPAVQASDPVIVSPAGAFYTKSISSVTQAFFSNGTVTQLTGPKVFNSGPSSGYITLPGGLIVQWGNFSKTSFSGNASVTLSSLGPNNITFPNNVFTASFSLACTSSNSPGPGTVVMDQTQPSGAGAYQNMGFDLNHMYFRFSGTGTDTVIVYWIMIGN